jgi:DNA adenine methylase
MSLKPIIKWSGGKRAEIKSFEKYIPLEYSTYIEPFVGGGAVYFHLAPQKAVIADVHPELIALYKTIKSGDSEVIHSFMKEHPNDEKTYYEVRDAFEPTTDIERACKFYYERKTCFRGMLRYNKKGKFNIPFGRYKTLSYDDILDERYRELLSRTEVLNGSFEEIFQNYNSSDNFVFLDPPYDSVFTDYGYCKFEKAHHERLAECFKTTKNKCLMVIGKTDFIVELYKDYIVEEFDKKYAFKLHSGRIGDEINTSHLIIKNY